MPFMYRMTPSWRCSISCETIACDASASSSSAGKPAFPRYIEAERTISRMTAVTRIRSEKPEPASCEILFSSEELFSTCGNKRNSSTYQDHTNPAGRTHVFAQNIFRAQSAHDITERRSRNHKTDGAPGKQNEQGIKRKRHQWHACPKPPVAHCAL